MLKFQIILPREVCIQQDRHVYLTVVYFGQEGLEEVRKILDLTAR